MKIGILTFGNGYNYGAILQCYALQKYLKNNDFDVEVINFKKEKKYGKSKYNFLAPAYMARKIYALEHRKQIKEKRKKFDDFFYDCIAHYPQNFISEDDISEYANKYDIILFGSDQIWNLSEKIYDRSRIFFGEFCFDGKKISYAASFGDSIEIAKKNKEYIKKMLSKFKNISVREKSGYEFLNENGINNTFVVDPTLLLNKNDWNLLCEASKFKKIPQKYILYYSVNCRRFSWEVAKKISKITGLKVINLEEHPKIIKANFINDYVEGPKEFLDLVKNAEYVVTNSFHGTIFSLIFQKKLVPVFDVKNGEIIKEERKYSLLEMAGLLNLVTTNETDIDISVYDTINYTEVQNKLDVFIKNSKSYLKESCGEIID